MDKYALIDIDQMEPSIVRRRLRRWSKADEEAIRPLVLALRQRKCLQDVHVSEPCYETNVYPLYYYWAQHKGVSHKDVYDRVFQSLPTESVSLKEKLRPHISRLADTEIDLLVEDIEYFAFIEAKEVKQGAKAIFQSQGGVHQLVRQYVQGRVLEKEVKKTFALATIGANNAQPLEIKLKPTERALLRLVGEEKEFLHIVDLSWPS